MTLTASRNSNDHTGLGACVKDISQCFQTCVRMLRWISTLVGQCKDCSKNQFKSDISRSLLSYLLLWCIGHDYVHSRGLQRHWKREYRRKERDSTEALEVGISIGDISIAGRMPVRLNRVLKDASLPMQKSSGYGGRKERRSMIAGLSMRQSRNRSGTNRLNAIAAIQESC